MSSSSEEAAMAPDINSPPRIRCERRREGIRIARADRGLQDAARRQVAVAVVVDRDALRGLARGALELHPADRRGLAAAVAGGERRGGAPGGPCGPRRVGFAPGGGPLVLHWRLRRGGDGPPAPRGLSLRA